ncbi:MAG: hypothetical protein IPH31_26920 [Lewinellaceae bacterium]|jgi:hypothetical protein|nr:hypothetical protein [Lewinellaceae bacterium]
MSQKSDVNLMLKAMTIGYVLNFAFGLGGSFFPQESFWQMTLWQCGDSLAIMASVLASRYVGSRGSNIVAGGFSLLGISYGVSFASSSINAINEEKMGTIILPLVPAMLLISLGPFFPKWLRFATLLVVVPFFFMYQNVLQGTYRFDNLSNALAYSGIQILGLAWSMMIWQDYRKSGQ